MEKTKEGTPRGNLIVHHSSPVVFFRPVSHQHSTQTRDSNVVPSVAAVAVVLVRCRRSIIILLYLYSSPTVSSFGATRPLSFSCTAKHGRRMCVYTDVPQIHFASKKEYSYVYFIIYKRIKVLRCAMSEFYSDDSKL